MTRISLHRKVWRVSCEALEERRCLSAVSFTSHDIVVSESNGASSVIAADLDQDGDLDVVSGSTWDGKIAWYENTDGRGVFGQQRVITTTTGLWFQSSLLAADVDADGDLDVLALSLPRIAWYPNADGKGTFGEPKEILASETHELFDSMDAADLDGDGDLDVLSAANSQKNSTVAWQANTDGLGTFGERQVIFSDASRTKSAEAADLDGDGDLDVLLASDQQNSSTIAWFENTDGLGSFGKRSVVSIDVPSTSAAFAADMDGDGDVDILSADSRGGKLVWHENTDGRGSFGPQHIVNTRPDSRNSFSVNVADLDGDGDMDILESAGDRVAWYENTNGKGSFGQEIVITPEVSGVRSVFPADVDGDGKLDVLSASMNDDKIAWYRNTDGQGSFGKQQLITTPGPGAPMTDAADLDGDGDVDVLFASYGDNVIAWYENTDGQGTFGDRQVVAHDGFSATSVHAVDMDGDRDLDILWSSLWHTVAWYENIDGQGSFGPQRIISGQTGWHQFNWGVHSADIDGDGDLDVLSSSSASTSSEGEIAWYRNDGEGSFSQPEVIAVETRLARSVVAADADGDGDLDVFTVSSDTEIAWYENIDGQGSFGPSQLIALWPYWVEEVRVSDLDGDGDADLLWTSSGDVAWYENTDGRGSFAPRPIIARLSGGQHWVTPTDIDGDGDVDVVLSDYDFSSSIGWFENSDGNGTFAAWQPIAAEHELMGQVHALDIDSDGDVDLLSATGVGFLPWPVDKITWYEQRVIGDSNDDGVFDSGDLVKVLQTGKYQDGIPNNATFDEGDWNQDGDFDSGDLVFAFQAGHYVVAATPLKAQLAAAIDWLFASDTAANKSRPFVA